MSITLHENYIDLMTDMHKAIIEIHDRDKEIKKLQAENEILKEAAEFYAEVENWYVNRFSNSDVETVGYSSNGVDICVYKGGKRARAALEEIKQLNPKED